MSNIINEIAAQYSTLKNNCPSRNAAFGIVYNNAVVGTDRLCDHPKGKAVASRVLAQLGYTNDVVVSGSLDDL